MLYWKMLRFLPNLLNPKSNENYRCIRRVSEDHQNHQIGSILVKHGFKEMISHTFLGRRIRKRRIRQHKPVYTTQERLRLTIEDLGPTYIKFGQILADRPDILSERFRKELKKLQTNALPFDDHLAIRLIEDN